MLCQRQPLGQGESENDSLRKCSGVKQQGRWEVGIKKKAASRGDTGEAPPPNPMGKLWSVNSTFMGSLPPKVKGLSFPTPTSAVSGCWPPTRSENGVCELPGT